MVQPLLRRVLSGISRETFYHHFRADRGFSDKMELSRNWLSTIAKQNIARAIKAGDIKSSVWLLEKHDSFAFNAVADEVPNDDKNNDSIERFERLVQYRIDQYRHRLEASYEFVPKNSSKNVV